MPASPNQIALSMPRERFAQMKAVSATLGGANMSATVGALIKLAQMQGLIAEGIPGCAVKRLPDGVVVEFDGEFRRSHAIPLGAVAPLAETIRGFASGTERASELFDLDALVIVKKQGPSVKITLGGVGGPAKTWTCDLAVEFSDLLDAALAKAA